MNPLGKGIVATRICAKRLDSQRAVAALPPRRLKIVSVSSIASYQF